jgi:hypothetical protein
MLLAAQPFPSHAALLQRFPVLATAEHPLLHVKDDGTVRCSQSFPSFTHSHEGDYLYVPPGASPPAASRARFGQDLAWNHLSATFQFHCRKTHRQPYAKQGALMALVQRFQTRFKKQEKMRLTCFNGASAHFPLDQWPAVWAARAEDIAAGLPVYDNEFAYGSEGIRLFFELDHRVPLASAPAEIFEDRFFVDSCRAIQRVLQEFFPSADLMAHVLLCRPKFKESAWISTGCHLVFPQVVVTCPVGKQLCHLLAQRAGVVVDAAPYKSEVACLRPAHSRKLGRCNLCFAALVQPCPVCLGCSKIGDASVYVPVYTLTREQVLQPYSGGSTSIIPGDQQGFTATLVQVPSLPERKKAVCIRNERRPTQSTGVVQVSPRQLAEIEGIVAAAAHPQDTLGRLKVCRVAGNRYVVQTGSKYCPMAARCHTKNHTYFEITRRLGVIRKCYNAKCHQTGTYPTTALPKRALKILF